MPVVGLGTFPIIDAAVFEQAVELGYRHFDTASFYHNEEELGQGLRKAMERGLCYREELFIVTKIWDSEYSDPEAALRRSLTKLGMEYVDCYLIHWPNNWGSQSKKPYHILWKELEALVDLGLAKSIGVSNFNVQLLSDMLCYARHKPVCNQVQLFPGCAQEDLVKFCLANNVVPVAYSPCGRSGA